MKTMSLMAVTAMMTTGAFADGRTPAARTDIALNRMEIQQQESQNEELDGDMKDQQAQIFNLIKEKEDLQYDIQYFQNKREKAALTGHSSRLARIDRKIEWDEALLAANQDNIRELLAAETKDIGLMNLNGQRIDQEQAAIQRDKSN